jgi:hypothetical protein
LDCAVEEERVTAFEFVAEKAGEATNDTAPERRLWPS